MTREELNRKYWKYYLMLEKRFIESIEYVELHEDNYNAFSNTYALLIQAIGGELDTVFKIFCSFNTSDRKNIADYARYILENNPEITDIKIVLNEYHLVIQPFKNWNKSEPGQSLQWWTAFTNLKHDRYEQMKEANQENALNILGALYLLEMMHLKKITENSEEADVFNDSSSIFTLKNWTSKVVPDHLVLQVLTEEFENGPEAYNRKFDA